MSDTLIQPFMPVSRWTRAFQRDLQNYGRQDAILVLARPDGAAFHYKFQLLPDEKQFHDRNQKRLARLVKTLLWTKGGSRVHFFGPQSLLEQLRQKFATNGARAFDAEFMGPQLCGEKMSFYHHESVDSLPLEKSIPTPLGRHLEGCRIGFDLGGSDRKTAALIDGVVVFSEETPWDPYFQSDPEYHLEGIRHSLRRAAEHLPRVDAIGGSAAGIYLDNEVRVASLFRGVTDKIRYDNDVRPIFKKLRAEYGGIPFEVINDGDVTALAASMNFGINSVLGIAMGTSLAVGYCDPNGQLTPGINELAFAPIDDNPDAPIDEWSGDRGCGVQYFSQQAVARHAKNLGFDFRKMPYPEQLIEVQKALKNNDPRARSIFKNIGRDLALSLPHYAEFYAIENVLILGRVTSEEGGEIIIESAKNVLAEYEPNFAEKIRFVIPDEKMKRHGQAIAAASLPALAKTLSNVGG